ncbi:MAG TPA: alpha-amylase [Lachnospiraceae bacterium]|nr:alpha-amylase [Lachnospiraceae bacterium]
MKNETMMQYFEWYLPADGLLWKRVSAQADKLKAAGITTLWLPPAYKGMNGKKDVGYGVYDIYDLGEFDQKGSVETKYGNREDYLKAVKTLQRKGIRFLCDIVLNHMMGADGLERVMAVKTAENNRQQMLNASEEISAWTVFDFPGRNGKYSGFTWNKSHFSGSDWDESKQSKGLYLFEGKCWNHDTDDEKGNYDYLMGADLDMDNEEVREQLQEWGSWYENTVHMDGFRLDAVKHISADFYKDWLNNLRKQTGKDLFAVGEYWHTDLTHLTKYLDEVDQEMSLFDVPLHFNFFNASRQQGTYDMRGLISNSLLSVNAKHAVTFVDNHDTQPGQALQTFVESWFKPIAYAMILLWDGGIPCVFYGDYYGIPSRNIAPVLELPRLIKIRELYAYGRQESYFDHDNVVGFVRRGDDEHENSGLAVLMNDGAGGVKKMLIGRKMAGMQLYDVTGDCSEPVTIDHKGYGDFRVEGGSVSVWVRREAYEYLETMV